MSGRSPGRCCIAAEALSWPEINVVLAATFMSAVGDIRRFADRRKLTAYQRVRARRGHSIAIVASARKLACLFWSLLTRGEDYAFAQPSLTKKKMRRLELQAGAPRRQGGRGVWSTNEAMRHAERELALQAQRAYQRTVKDRQQNTGASATPGRASSGSSTEQVARQTPRPKSAL
jgi:hypothetical protein